MRWAISRPGDTERRRRETMIPLVRSAFGYAVYFGTAILILSLLGFNPMPFLARRAPIFVGTDERYPSEVIIRVWKVD